MSIQAVSWAIQQRTGGPTEKAVLMALANYADANGECYPSYGKIADDCEVSRRTVIRVMDRLCEMGLVEKTANTRQSGGDTANVYRLTGCQIVTGECQDVTGGGVTGDTGGVTLVSPLMNLQSNRKPSKKVKLDVTPVAESLWLAQPITGGKRKTTRPDVVKALNAAIGRGGDPDQILLACRAYYALPGCRKDEGQYAMGVQPLLNLDRWKDFLPSVAKASATPVPDGEYRRHIEAHYRATGEWKPEWGEKPRQAA